MVSNSDLCTKFVTVSVKRGLYCRDHTSKKCVAFQHQDDVAANYPSGSGSGNRRKRDGEVCDVVLW